MNLGTIIRVPRGTPDLPALELDLKDIILIEKRKSEMAYVNKETAPELMYIFNEGFCIISKMMTEVGYEYNIAVKHANKRKSIVILDVVPSKLKDKGLATARSPVGSEDLRTAVLNLDEEYSDLMDKVHAISAVYEFLKGKAEGMKMAYYTVKNVYNMNNGSLGSNSNLSVSKPQLIDGVEIGEAIY